MDSKIIFVMLASIGVIALILYSSHADKRKKWERRNRGKNNNTPNFKDFQNQSNSSIPAGLHIRKGFLNNRERTFFNRLTSLYGDRCHVLTQVRIIDFIKLDKTVLRDNETLKEYFKRIFYWHCGFVLVDNDFNVMCVIEIIRDDSHRMKDKSETYFDLIFRQAGIPFFRYRIADEIGVRS